MNFTVDRPRRGPAERYHSVMNAQELRQTREVADRALSSAPVVFAYVYGSRAISNQRPDSDLDIAVYLDDSVPTAKYIDLSLKLTSTLAGSGLPRAEVVVLNNAPLPLLGRIIKQRIVIFSGDEPRRVAFESRKYREFLDFDFHARQLDAQALEDIAKGRR